MSKKEQPKRKMKRRRRTPKQAKLIKERLKNPDATMQEIGEKAGYPAKSARVQAQKYLGKPEVKDKILAAMEDREKLKLGSLFKKLEEGLDADKDGFEGAKSADYATRHRYLETAAKWRGDLTQRTDGDSIDNPLDIAVLLGTKGTVEDREQAGQILLAIRIRRGLHPTENRKMTPEELEEWKRTHPGA